STAHAPIDCPLCSTGRITKKSGGFTGPIHTPSSASNALIHRAPSENSSVPAQLAAITRPMTNLCGILATIDLTEGAVNDRDCQQFASVLYCVGALPEGSR